MTNDHVDNANNAIVFVNFQKLLFWFFIRRCSFISDVTNFLLYVINFLSEVASFLSVVASCLSDVASFVSDVAFFYQM